MRKLGIIAVLSLLVTALAAVPALAAPHFQSASGTIGNNGALTVSFDERGLGNGNINYSLTGDATATWACFNGGGKHPQAANKETETNPVVEEASFESKNGRVVASFSTDAPTTTFTCPSGQRLRLASISYTDLVLTDTTNGTSTNLADVSRVFFSV